MVDVIERRSPAGHNDSVQGWHNLLKKILSQMAPYLREFYGSICSRSPGRDEDGSDTCFADFTNFGL